MRIVRVCWFKQCRVGIANCDDVHWQLITKEHTCSLETYGMSKKADLRAQNLQFTNRQGHLGHRLCVTGLRISMQKSRCREGFRYTTR